MNTITTINITTTPTTQLPQSPPTQLSQLEHQPQSDSTTQQKQIPLRKETK